jgi:hypothetical protein
MYSRAIFPVQKLIQTGETRAKSQRLTQGLCECFKKFAIMGNYATLAWPHSKRKREASVSRFVNAAKPAANSDCVKPRAMMTGSNYTTGRAL